MRRDVHAVGQMNQRGIVAANAVLLPQFVPRHVMVQNRFRVLVQGRQIFQKQITVNGVIPHIVRFKRHHAVDFFRFVCADVVENAQQKQRFGVQRQAALLAQRAGNESDALAMVNQALVNAPERIVDGTNGSHRVNVRETELLRHGIILPVSGVSARFRFSPNASPVFAISFIISHFLRDGSAFAANSTKKKDFCFAGRRLTRRNLPVMLMVNKLTVCEVGA